MTTGKIETICIICGVYPNINNQENIFLDQLVCAFADLGIKCKVIAPNNILKKILKRPQINSRRWVKTTINGNSFEIFCPNRISFSNKNLLFFNTVHLSIKCFEWTIIKEYRKQVRLADAVYGHFVLPSGVSAAKISELFKIPSFLAYGESSPIFLESYRREEIAKKLSHLSGVISVSSENKKILIENKLVDKEKIGVFPNSINEAFFYPRNKTEMRHKFGYENSDFIVAFVGHFDNRKGSQRVSNAIKKLEKVKSIFIGTGTEPPNCQDILYCGTLPHEQIPEMLSVADVFVLPTLAEGCCNAIIEAMACGLPIISSDRPFNDDILNEDNSIRIDPENIDEIAIAIKKLRDNSEMRESMAQASIKKAESLNIKQRAANILEFMNRKAGY